MMKGDYSRITFDRSKRYSGVRMQQGRVQLDADWNEQVDIADYLRRTAVSDLVGTAGAPEGDDGFEIEVNTGGEITISTGRYYVDGILCENNGETGDPTPIDQQPDLPEQALPTVNDDYVVYLDVWQRHITALEDPDLLELALGGPDTTTRTKTVWQVKLLALGALAAECGSFTPSWTANGEAAPVLKARSASAPMENQLFRVEVHEPGYLGAATFKWSRDNGTMAARIDNPSLSQIHIIQQIGQDATSGFAAGQWVEVTDEHRMLKGEPGVFARLATVSGQILTVEGWPSAGDPAPDLPNNPIVRRWDSDSDGIPVAIAADNEGYVALDDGIEIRFGDEGDRPYRTGDYWLIPVRARAGVLWPEDEYGAPVYREPDGIRHHFAPLAIANRAGGAWQVIESCRKLFLPTTEIPGPEKVSRAGDTMSGDLVIQADLTVEGVATIGGAGAQLVLDAAPIIPAVGDDDERGLLFPVLGTSGNALMRYFAAGGGGKLRLGVEDEGELSLYENGGDRLTIAGSKVGIGTSDPQYDLHVDGDTFLFRPSNELRVEGPLVVSDGSQGEGKVLTSDGSGRATWEDLPQRNVGAPVFLDVHIDVASGSRTKDWTTYEIDSDKVPDNPSAIIVQAWGNMGGPDSGDTDTTMRFRKAPNEADYWLLGGRASGSGDNVAWAGQGLFPIRHPSDPSEKPSFQYRITAPGFNDWQIYIVGYFP